MNYFKKVSILICSLRIKEVHIFKDNNYKLKHYNKVVKVKAKTNKKLNKSIIQFNNQKTNKIHQFFNSFNKVNNLFKSINIINFLKII